MPNLVKQRFIVEKEQQKRIINSNEKMEQILGKQVQNEFQQGLFAAKVEVGSEDTVLDAEEDGYIDVDVTEPQETEAAVDTDEQIVQLLEDANRQAQEILESARIQSETEAEAIKQEAYEQGLATANQELQELKNKLYEEVDMEKQRLQQELECQLEAMEPLLVDTFLSIVEDVLSVEISDYRQIILDLMKQTIMGMENPKELAVMVSEQNYEYIKPHFEEIREMLGEEAKVEVLKSAQLQDDECKIETEYGIYQCGFDRQLRNLSNRIRVLSRQKQ